MHKLSAFAAIIWTSLAVTASTAKPQPPAALIEARRAFAAAVSANNEGAAAELTSFPLKNVVYKGPATLARRAFARLFADYTDMAACIATAPLAPEKGGWIIDCNGNILRFEMRAGRWLHTAYENINE